MEPTEIFEIGDEVEAIEEDANIEIGQKYIVSKGNHEFYGDFNHVIEIEGNNKSPYYAYGFKLIKRATPNILIFN